MHRAGVFDASGCRLPCVVIVVVAAVMATVIVGALLGLRVIHDSQAPNDPDRPGKPGGL
jgi:hypothetical protein